MIRFARMVVPVARGVSPPAEAGNRGWYRTLCIRAFSPRRSTPSFPAAGGIAGRPLLCSGAVGHSTTTAHSRSERLAGEERPQGGDAGRRGESRPGQDGVTALTLLRMARRRRSSQVLHLWDLLTFRTAADRGEREVWDVNHRRGGIACAERSPTTG